MTMRIKWTSIPNVMTTNPDSAAPYAANGAAERQKPETMKEREPDKKDKKKKSERSLDWLRRSR